MRHAWPALSIAVLAFAVAALALSACGGPQEPLQVVTADDGKVSFEGTVLPIFQETCVKCHGGKAGLDLDSHAGVLKGGEGGPVVVAGDPDASLLVRHIEGTEKPRMPPFGGELSADRIGAIRAWISEGALEN